VNEILGLSFIGIKKDSQLEKKLYNRKNEHPPMFEKDKEHL